MTGCPQDTVAVQELRFGDNDTLSAQVAVLVEADHLFLLTDVDALYTSNPKVSNRSAMLHDFVWVYSMYACPCHCVRPHWQHYQHYKA